MRIDDILNQQRTQVGASASSKKKAIEQVAKLISDDAGELDLNELITSLMARERLGSTGLGHGIAIPHCRLAGCKQVVGALMRLEHPIEFDAIDGEPVDLLFALIVPQDANQAHLETLAALAERFEREDYRSALRAQDSAEALFAAAVR